MIKTREDLRMTFVRNEGAVAKKWAGIVDCKGLASLDDSYYLCLDKNARASYMPKYSALVRGWSEEWLVNAGYREVTLEDFELGAIRETTPEDTPEKFTPIKGSLTGIKVRINGREQWDRLKELCEGVGLEHATWDECDFNSRTTAFMCGHKGRFLAENQWEDNEDTSEEFTNLREVLYEDVFVKEEKAKEETMTTCKYKYEKLITDSISELFELFTKDGLYASDSEDRITTVEELLEMHRNESIYTREEVQWQKDLLDYLRMPSAEGFEEELPTRITVSFDGEDFYLTDSEFLEAARVALRNIGELNDE